MIGTTVPSSKTSNRNTFLEQFKTGKQPLDTGDIGGSFPAHTLNTNEADSGRTSPLKHPMIVKPNFEQKLKITKPSRIKIGQTIKISRNIDSLM